MAPQGVKVVRQVSGGTGRPDDDFFQIVSESKDGAVGGYAFHRSDLMTEAEVLARMQAEGLSPASAAQMLAAARLAFSKFL